MNKLFLSAILALFFCSCVPQKKLVYFQPPAQDDTVVTFRDTGYAPVIQPHDILTIFVASVSADASKYFNYTENADVQGSMANGYLVDARGFIQMPLIGMIKVSGMTSAMARDTIIRKLEKYVINPSVKLNISNYRVTVMGEVSHPGVFSVNNERITMTEALALAGDLTVFSNRTNILVIREVAGKKQFGVVDLTSRDLFNSPYYYLHCNDIIYVEATRNKRFTAQNYYRVLPVLFGGFAILIAVFQASK